MQVANATRTVFSTHSEPMANVASIKRDSPEEKARQKEEMDYTDATRWQISTASYTDAQYDNFIKGLQRFLDDHPQSMRVDSIKQALTQCQAERSRVISGEIKWNNTWYQGGAADKLRSLIKAKGLLAEGDQYLVIKNFETAVGKYRASLAVRPQTSEMIGLANQKIIAACQQWKCYLDTLNATDASCLAAMDKNTASMQDKMGKLQQQLCELQKRKQLVDSAQYIQPGLDPQYPQGHWISNGTDFGTVRPASPSTFDFETMRNNISNIGKKIAENEADKRSKQAEQNAIAIQMQNMNILLNSVANEVAMAKKDAIFEQNLAAAEANAQAQRNTEAAEAVKQAKAAEAAKQAEAAEAAKQAKTTEAPKQTETATPEKKPSLFKRYWMWAGIAVLAVVPLLVILSRRIRVRQRMTTKKLVAKNSFEIENPEITNYVTWTTTEFEVRKGDIIAVGFIGLKKAHELAVMKNPAVNHAKQMKDRVWVKTKNSAGCLLPKEDVEVYFNRCYRAEFQVAEDEPLIYAATAGAYGVLTLEVYRDN